jgi:hypothetical protein
VQQHFKRYAARQHTLRTAGWKTALSDHVWAFANNVAVLGTFTD